MTKTHNVAGRPGAGRTRRGASLPLLALTLVVLLGMAALALDLAAVYAARRRAQALADAGALAGGRLLPAAGPAPNAATQDALALVAANGGDRAAFTARTDQTSVTRDDGTAVGVNAGDSVTVTGYVNAPLSFAPLFGYRPVSRDGRPNTKSVSAQASALVQNLCAASSGAAIAPFGLLSDDPTVSKLLTTTAGSQTPQPGVYQPLSKQVTLRVTAWRTDGSVAIAGDFDPLQISAATSRTYQDTLTGERTSHSPSGRRCRPVRAT